MVTADMLAGFIVGWTCAVLFFLVLLAAVWWWWRGRRS